MTDLAVSARKRRRWLPIALTASLALNAFLLGAMVTDYLGLFHWGGPRAVNFELRWLQGRLPPEALDEVETAVAAARPEAEQHFRRLRELRLSLGKLAAEPQPDRAAIDTQLAEIRAELSAMQTENQKRVMDALLALPPDMRSRLGDAAPGPPAGKDVHKP